MFGFGIGDIDMRKRLCSLSPTGFLWCAAFMVAVSPGFSSIAHAQNSSTAPAQNIAGECSLSGSPSPAHHLAGCPSNPNPNPTPPGYLTSTYALRSDGTCSSATAPYCGAKSDTPSAAVPIEAWNVCRWIDNTSPSAIFVPFKSSKEWSAFLSAAPNLLGGHNAINPVGCALPAGDHGAPVRKNIIPTHTNGITYQDCTNSFYVSTPTVFGRTGISRYPDPPVQRKIICQHSAAPGVQLDTTIIQTSPLQWTAGDAGTPIVPNTISWTLSPHISYGPNVVLASTLKNGVAQTRLGWAVVPFNPADPVSCTALPGGWGPNAGGAPAVGFSNMATTSNATYVLSCTEAGLTTMAAIVVAAWAGH